MTAFTPSQQALADRIEEAILDALKGRLRAPPSGEEPTLIIHRDAQLLAMIAMGVGGPTHPFRHVAARLTRKELRAIVRANGRQRHLSVRVRALHATAIDLLADAGWTRHDLLSQPHRAAMAAQLALDNLAGAAELPSVNMKPRKDKEIGITKILANLFERTTSRRATHAEEGPFLKLLDLTANAMPMVCWGNLEGLARTAILQLRKQPRSNTPPMTEEVLLSPMPIGAPKGSLLRR